MATKGREKTMLSYETKDRSSSLNQPRTKAIVLDGLGTPRPASRLRQTRRPGIRAFGGLAVQAHAPLAPVDSASLPLVASPGPLRVHSAFGRVRRPDGVRQRRLVGPLAMLNSSSEEVSPRATHHTRRLLFHGQ